MVAQPDRWGHEVVYRFEELDERKRVCLRLIYARYDIKSIALKLGISPDGVKYHLKGAREILSVSSSTHAARLLWEHEHGSDYPPGVAPPKVVGAELAFDKLATSTTESPRIGPGNGYIASEPMVHYTPAPNLPASSFPWPFPTRGRPHNDLTSAGKLQLILVCAASIGAGLLVVAAISQSVGQLSLELVHLLFQLR